MVVPFGLVALGVLLAYSGLKNKTLLETIKGLPGSVPSVWGSVAAYNASAVASTGSGSGTDKSSAGPSAPSPGAGAARTVQGVGSWHGIQVAKWIIPALKWAQDHGGSTAITSGYRPGFDSHTATGTSEHQGTKYPHGAIDFGAMTDSAARVKRDSFLHSLHGYSGPKLIAPQGFHDDGHCSGNGH